MSNKKRIRQLERRLGELEARLAAVEAQPSPTPWFPQQPPWQSPFFYTGEPMPVTTPPKILG